MNKKITSIDELKKLAIEEQGSLECFILLNGGVISRKLIDYDEDKETFWILNMVDDTKQRLTEDELNDERRTNIGKAIKLGSFYLED